CPLPRSFSSFSRHWHVPLLALLSFPTRRSSDLGCCLRRELDRPRSCAAARVCELHELRLRGCAGGHVEIAERERHRIVEEQRLRSEEHTSELQSHLNLVCRLLLEKKKKKDNDNT